MQNSVNSSVLDFQTQNNFFRQIWSKTSNPPVLAENWQQLYLEYKKSNGGVHFFSFKWEPSFFCKFRPKDQNFQFNLKFCTQNNYQFEYAELNSVVHHSCVRPKRFFLGKFGPKTKYCQFKRKFGLFSNLKMQSSMAVFTFPVLDGKHHFGQILLKKLKIVSFS